MIESKYFKDYEHNYLILKCKDGGAGESYSYRMLASGKIEKLLKCSVRNVNGDTYFYYDISSKVTLENLYRGKKMSYEVTKDFFNQLDMIYRNLGRFFMEEKGLLIQPENIYYDLTSGQYLGLYYPGADTEWENPYEALMDFLIEHIDSKDQKLTDIVYRLYEMAGEKYFSMAEVPEMFEEGEESVVSECIITDAKMDTGEQPFLQEYEQWGHIETGTDMETALETKTKTVRRIPSRRKITPFYACFAGLSLCGIGAAVWVYLQFELTQQEFMMVVCCSAVMGLCFLLSLIQALRSIGKNKEAEEKDELLKRDIEDEFREERPVALDGVLDKNMDVSVAGIPYTENTSCRETSDTQYSETVFIDVRKQKAEYKLYALDKKNKKHIELTRFPFTIGKMAGCVDCVLADDSISRLHARIERENEKIYLTDMNSTNGTYKNGLRMEPSETIEIEPGDEIRFGKLNYCYR
ncbi:MAG: FHA domain-containing protein [Ruminococcus sp.]|nr:FHA domain-containing protein [Ruminococcus sp.]